MRIIIKNGSVLLIGEQGIIVENSYITKVGIVNNHHPRVVACQCGSFVSLAKSSNCSVWC